MMNTNLNRFLLFNEGQFFHTYGKGKTGDGLLRLGYDQIERVTGWPQRGAYSAAKTGVAAAKLEDLCSSGRKRI